MIVDNLVALRIIYLLVQPFENSEAYKNGVIDADGNPLIKIAQMDSKQKSSYTMLHRLVFRLKRALALIPFGKTRLASFAAAYMLVRESMQTNTELENLEEVFNSLVEDLSEKNILIEETQVDHLFEQFAKLEELIQTLDSMMVEDAVTVTTGIATHEKPLSGKKTVGRRAAIIDVDPDTFKKLRKGKQKNERWDAFLNLESEENKKIREYVKRNPSGVLVVRCKESNQGQLVRYKRITK